jgi:predicted glycogen debranching enzyme
MLMNEPVRTLRWDRAHPMEQRGGPQPESAEAERLVAREWLVTNGLGGYASGTVSGVITRRYHGLLIASLPAPIGRYVMLNELSEELRLTDGRVVNLGGEERVGPVLQVHGAAHLAEFRLERGLPVWLFDVDGVVIEKRVHMPHEHNTVHVTFRMLEGQGPVRLKLRPALHFRPYEAPVSTPIEESYILTANGDAFEIAAGAKLPPLRMMLHGKRKAFTVEGKRIVEVLYRSEQSRGYEATGDLWSPGFFRADLDVDQSVSLIASVEPWETITGLPPGTAQELEHKRRMRLLSLASRASADAVGAELVLAADQFIVTPAARAQEAARAQAAGDAARTIIAGYHWFTDWGRDTMISLEGLTLTTGRYREGAHILRTFAHHVRDGLIPNMFPDGATQGLYHTADATLWFFHAIDRYVSETGDVVLVEELLPTLRSIVEHHLRGTHYGIRVDSDDGLLIQGEEGYQLTWMDAKCDGWVVTPRRGKAVEINALWYNALCVLDKYMRQIGAFDEAAQIANHAHRTRTSFNARFWYEAGGYLYDVVDSSDGDDSACRPNQVLAISLTNAVLEPERWPAVMTVVEERLLTPCGLRSLAPGHPDYRSNYHGDLRTRDAAYHQGTVWAWLIGPFIDAWLKVHPGNERQARAFLHGLVEHLDDFGVGTVAEVFDAEPPFTARGCIAQAWSVAELLRCWVALTSAP